MIIVTYIFLNEFYYANLRHFFMCFTLIYDTFLCVLRHILIFLDLDRVLPSFELLHNK
jgi:hypothetical protein